VKKIYEGTKTFLKEKVKAQIILFEHIKPLSLEPSSSCIEIVSYIYGFETIDVPRIYVSASKIFPRLNNKLIVQGSNYAQESITSYIFSRISMSIEGIDTKQAFGINLKYKKDSLANDLEFKEGVEFNGEKFLGPLPFIDHIKGSPEKSPVQLIWDEKLSLFLDDRAKCSTATTQAQRKSLTVLNQFSKSFPEDEAGVSVPRKRWCKSIRKVLVQICVSTMKAKLDSISTVDEIIPLQVSPKISVRDKYSKSFPADLPSSNDFAIGGLKSNSGNGKVGKFSIRSEKFSTASETFSAGSKKFSTGSEKFITGGGKGTSKYRPLIRGRLSFDSFNDSVSSDMNDNDDSCDSLDKVNSKLDNMIVVERYKRLSRSEDATGTYY
jgi:hypothetical protein